MLRRNKKLALVLSLLLILTMVAGCGSQKGTTSSSADSKVVKIGFLGALTGDVACYGKPGLNGLKMAAEDLNAKGGILGKKVEIVAYDNAGDKAQAASITKKYISKDKVSAIIGDPCTGVTIAAAKVAQANKMVLISAGATGKGAIDAGDYCFRNTLLDEVACPATVEYLVSKGYKNIALVTAVNDEYSVGLSDYFRNAIKAKGAKIVIDESIQRGDTNFSAQVTKIKPTNPDIIVFTGYYQEAALFMKEVRKQGMKDIKFVGGDGCLGEDLYKLGGEAVEGSMIYCGFSPENPTPETKKFLDAYTKKYNSQADMFSVQYYDALMIVAQAMEKANSTDPAVYQKEMLKVKNFPGLSGVTTFRANREPIKSPVYLLEVKDASFKLKDRIPVKTE